MKQHHKKIIETICITLLLLLYWLFFLGFLIAILRGFWKLVPGLILVLLSVNLLRFSHERIKEIRSGE